MFKQNILWLHFKKGIFQEIIAKSNNIAIAGAHTGAPLQKLVNPLNIGVGEGPCALPWKKSRDDLLGNQSKKWFLQWNHTIKKDLIDIKNEKIILRDRRKKNGTIF